MATQADDVRSGLPSVAAADFNGKKQTVTIEGIGRYLVTVVLSFGYPWLILSNTPGGDRGSWWVVTLVIATWSGARLAGMLVRGEPRLFEFIFWLFCYLFMGIAPAAQMLADNMPTTTPGIDPGGDQWAVALAALGIVGFEIGRFISKRRSSPDSLIVETSSERPAIETARNVIILAASAPISIYVVTVVGPMTFFKSRDERGAGLSGIPFDRSVVFILAALSWVPALVVLQRILVHRFVARQRLGGVDLLCAAFSSVVLLFTNNPISSPRYAFGAMALSLIVSLGGCVNRKRTRKTLWAILVLMVLVFPVADTFRRSERADVGLDLTQEYLGNGDYDAFSQLHNSVTVVEQEGHSFLRQPLGVAFFWVPRSVWPTKPVDTGIYLALARGYSFTNLSAPLWAELYMAGGASLVLGGFIGLGYWLRRTDGRAVRAIATRSAYNAAWSFMPFYMILLLRGSLLQAMAVAATFLAFSSWAGRSPSRKAR